MKEDNANLQFINTLFIYNIKNVELVSTFLASSLENDWKNYYKEKSPRKKSRIANSILLLIEKLKKIENKKSIKMDTVIKDNVSFIGKNKENVDNKYARSLVKRIKQVESISDLLMVFIGRFNSSDVINDTPKKEREHKVNYVLFKDGYAYANMIVREGVLSFSKRSFSNEVYLFNKGVEEDTKLVLEVPVEYKDILSSQEKKRRIYLKTMFKLNKEMYQINNKELNFIYPIEKYFEFANEIVANLYKELFEYSKKDVFLNKLWQETINNYGCKRCLLTYESIYWKTVNRFQYLDDMLLDNYIDVTSIEKVKKDNIYFKDIDNIIPSPEDIYGVLANLIIKNTNVNFNYYMLNEKNILESIEYMTIEQIVEFYKVLRNIAISRKSTNSRMTKIQRLFAVAIAKRINSNDYKEIVRKYLDEEVIFK